MEENLFKIVCDICETETRVTVLEVDEYPQFCPMCGEQVESEIVPEEEP